MSYFNSVSATIAPSQSSAFGTIEVGELTPILQLDFIYGINTQTGTSTIANTGVVDTNASRLRLQTGTNTAGSAIFQSKKVIKYRPGQGITARFTPLFTTGAASSTQIIGVGDSVNGYFFGFNGTSFGIMQRNGGSDTWIPQNTWNGDKVDGSPGSSFTWDVTKGTPVMIKYPFLGFGDIFFYVQNPLTGAWILVHTIRYANTTSATQVTIPDIFFYAQAINAGNNTNLTLYIGSAGIFLSGVRNYSDFPKWAADNNKAAISTETSILGLKNCTTFNGIANRVIARLNAISVGTASNSVCVVRLKVGATLGGTPSYAPISGSTADNGTTITSGNSVISVDTAATTVSGGTYEFNMTVGSTGTGRADLTPFEIYISPGETLTISAFATANTTVGVSINWTEDL